MLNAIEQVHRVGSINRDIKPSNFIIKGSKLYITDFGTVQDYKKDG
jgi:serine/threonine protein kinase